MSLWDIRHVICVSDNIYLPGQDLKPCWFCPQSRNLCFILHNDQENLTYECQQEFKHKNEYIQLYYITQFWLVFSFNVKCAVSRQDQSHLVQISNDPSAHSATPSRWLESVQVWLESRVGFLQWFLIRWVTSHFLWDPGHITSFIHENRGWFLIAGQRSWCWAAPGQLVSK